MDPKELEYLAECEAIQVVPNFSRGKMYLISGDVGPFRPGLPLQVPLWMAINLRQSSKCKIVTPSWMSVEVLEAIKESEQRSESEFIKLPSEHFMAFGKLLFDACPGEIENADEVKTLMKDIWDKRSAKLRKSVKELLSKDLTWCVQVNNLTMMEMCAIRPFLTHSLEHLYRIKKTAHKNAEKYAQSQDLSRSSMNVTHSSMSHSESQSQTQ